MVIFGALHVVALVLGALLFYMFLRSDTTSTWRPPDDDDGGGGGGNDRLPPRPKPRPSGGVPLPDAVQSSRRLRGPGPGGKLFDRDGLGAYLDQVRRCYPRQAIVVTEFGAEANREGPPEEKGTWAFQQDFVNFHLNVFASKPWLSGAVYWALNEFRVKPDWEGGNPRPTPPIHQKGLLTYDTMSRKPAWADVRRLVAATNQYP